MSDSLLIPCAAEFSFSDSCLSFSLWVHWPFVLATRKYREKSEWVRKWRRGAWREFENVTPTTHSARVIVWQGKIGRENEEEKWEREKFYSLNSRKIALPTLFFCRWKSAHRKMQGKNETWNKHYISVVSVWTLWSLVQKFSHKLPKCHFLG